MLDGNAVTKQDCHDAVVGVTFDVLADRKTTVCTLTLYNGFTVRGESSCVDPANFDQSLGEKYAEENARQNVWPVLGAILAEKLYRNSTINLADTLQGPKAEAANKLSEAEAAAQTVVDALAARNGLLQLRDDLERAYTDAMAEFRRIAGGDSVAIEGYVVSPGRTLWDAQVTTRKY